jgi:hypothetical protein
MFQKKQLDNLFEDLNRDLVVKPDFERLLRETHLAIALADAGQALSSEIDERVSALLRKYGVAAT